MTTEEISVPAIAPYVPPTDEKKAFLAAFAKAQGAYERVTKNAHVIIKPRDSAAYEFDYADLDELLDKTRAALSANGLSTRLLLTGDDGKSVWLSSILGHAGGYEDVSSLCISKEGDVKQFGGRITYMRRYLLGPQLGVAGEGDEDQNGKAAGDVGAGASVETKPRGKPGPQRRQASAPAPSEPAGMPPEPPPEGELLSKPAVREDNIETVADRQAAAEDDTGELATDGECKFLVGLAKRKGAELREALDSMGLQRIPADTLKGITKARWGELKGKL